MNFLPQVNVHSFTGDTLGAMDMQAMARDDALPDGFARIRGLLRCPACAGPLTLDPGQASCEDCNRSYPVHGGIPLLALMGSSENWTGNRSVETSIDYQQAYQDLEEARKYNAMYRASAAKRWSTRREQRLLQELLGTQPRSAVVLDLPSGGGRLSPAIEPYTDLLIEADIALGQLLYGRERYTGGPAERVWMTASAFHIPLADASVDGVVCCRLCHHLPTAEERARLIAELMRVSRRFVVMTFFDHNSIKNYLRRARRPFDGKPPKMTMTIDEVREQARANGAELVAWPALFHLSSGHRYALMVKG